MVKARFVLVAAVAVASFSFANRAEAQRYCSDGSFPDPADGSCPPPAGPSATCPDGTGAVNGRCPASGQWCADGTYPEDGTCPIGVASSGGGTTQDTYASAPPVQRSGALWAGPSPEYGTHMDAGLIVVGTVLLVGGYGTSVVFAVASGNYLLAIPIAGSAITLFNLFGGSAEGVVIGAVLTAAQLSGLIMLIAGLAHHHPNDPPAAASLLPELAPGPGEVGLGLRWRF